MISFLQRSGEAKLLLSICWNFNTKNCTSRSIQIFFQNWFISSRSWDTSFCQKTTHMKHPVQQAIKQGKSMADHLLPRATTSIFQIENVNYHFLTHPPLQPKRNMIEAWNLACLVLRGVVFGPSRRFLICRPWAKIWGRGGSAQGVVKNHKESFFNFFSFFHFNQLDQGHDQNIQNYPINLSL